MGVLYKALSEEERAKYDALNSEDKLRFEKEMAAYKANKKADSNSDESDGDKKADSDSDSDDSDGSDSD